MRLKNILEEARGYIEQGWCQQTFAKNEMGEDIYNADADSAVCWCISGAVIRATNNQEAFAAAVGILSEAAGVKWADPIFPTLIKWNDAPERTQEDVLEVFDIAIEACEPKVTYGQVGEISGD